MRDRRRERSDRRRRRHLCDVGIEPELLGAHLYHITAAERLLLRHTRPVHPDAVRAVVGEHVPAGRGRDARVLARDLVRRDHDVVPHLAPEAHPRVRHRIFPTVHQGDQTPPGGSRRLPGRRRADRSDQLRQVRSAHERRVPALLVLTKTEFVPGDLNLVAVEERTRLRPEVNPIDHHDRAWCAQSDGHPRRPHQHHGVSGRIAGRQTDRGAVEGADRRLASREWVLPVLQLQVGHREEETTRVQGGSASVRRSLWRRRPTLPPGDDRVGRRVHYGRGARGVSRARELRPDASPGSRSPR